MPRFTGVIAGIVLGLVAVSCVFDDDDGDGFGFFERCRYNPECDGGIGGLCDSDRDCVSGFCCEENGNCNGGMCTFECDGDRDCPEDMLCEHDVCFFACDSDRDCAEGMSCEHGNTVCEWP